MKTKPEGAGKAGQNPVGIPYDKGASPETYADVLPVRFRSKVAVDEVTGCWIWTRSLTTHGGYGRYGLGGRGMGWQTAHRFAWERIVGEIPEGLELDHLCRRGACCNPAHLEAVTHAENVRRGLAANASGLCRRGLHAWEGENVIVEADGVRRCRACRNQWYRSEFSGVAPHLRTHCPKGHVYDEANTMRKPDGSRNCRACHRAHARERYYQQRAHA